MPARILDLFTEFRDRLNGLPWSGFGLVNALGYFGLDTIGADEKAEMRSMIVGGGPWNDNERAAILDYCESDVDALARLLPAMLPRLDLPRALLRGRYMAAAAAMEFAGVPIDVDMLVLLRQGWTGIQDELIAAIDADTASTRDARSRPPASRRGSIELAFRGHGWRAGSSTWPMIHSARRA